MGRFRIPRPHRVAMVLMEGSAWRTKKRLERLGAGKGGGLEDLEGTLFFWFRPPLRLSSATGMRELAAYVRELGLDLRILDNWSYLASGNSNDSDSDNDSDEVAPQLDGEPRRSGERICRSSPATCPRRKPTPMIAT